MNRDRMGKAVARMIVSLVYKELPRLQRDSGNAADARGNACQRVYTGERVDLHTLASVAIHPARLMYAATRVSD